MLLVLLLNNVLDHAGTPPVIVATGLYASDGSLNIRINDGGRGLFTSEGFLRIDTISSNGGVFSPSGGYRGTVSNNEASPAPGVGVYTPSGGYRMTQTPSAYYNQPGVYAKDGSFRVTVQV